MESRRPNTPHGIRAFLLALPLLVAPASSPASPSGTGNPRAEGAATAGQPEAGLPLNGPDLSARETCDIVFIGRVFTGDPGAPWTDVLGVRGDRIVYLGDTSSLSRLVGRRTRVIRARGGTILPGFRDAHAHLGTGLVGPGCLDLRTARSPEAVLGRVRGFGAEHPDDAVLLGFGWHLEDFPGEEGPTRAALDTIAPDRAVLLFGASPFALWVNSRAIEQAHIESRLAAGDLPPSTLIQRDEAGTPTGLFLGQGVRTLFGELLPSSPDSLRAAFLSELESASRFGVTSIQGPLSEALVAVLVSLQEEGTLPVRYQVEGVEPTPECAREDWISFTPPPDAAVPSSGANPAALLWGLADDPRLAALLGSGHEGIADVSPPHRGGQPIEAAVHEEAPTTPPPRLDRCMLLTPAELARLSERPKGIRVTRPALLLDGCWHKGDFLSHDLRLDPDTRILPLHQLLDAGTELAFGSDYPLAPLDPLVGIDAALHLAKTPLSLDEALRAATRGRAKTLGAQPRGVLTVGSLADIVVLDRNIIAFADADITRIEVKMTIVDGRVVFER